MNVHVQVAGPPGAPALLLLHALGTSLAVWEAQAEALSASFRVVRMDLRGHGLTVAAPGPCSIEGMARDALAVLDALGIARAHVGGVSVGGMIAQALAAAAPDRVLSLLLCDTALALPPPEKWRDRAATVRRKGMAAIVDTVLAGWVTPRFADAPAAHGLRAMLLRTDPEGYAAVAEAIANADLAPGTQHGRTKALVLVGDHDQSTTVAHAAALRDALGGTLTVIEGAAHMGIAERPEAVLEAMRDFLRPVGEDPYSTGLAVRRQVLGDAHVDRALGNASGLDRDFQAWITAAAWGGPWARPQLDRRTRSLITLAVLAALGHEEEFRVHARATRNTGASPDDVAEMLMHIAVYAGVPAAQRGLRLARAVFAESGS